MNKNLYSILEVKCFELLADLANSFHSLQVEDTLGTNALNIKYTSILLYARNFVSTLIEIFQILQEHFFKFQDICTTRMNMI